MFYSLTATQFKGFDSKIPHTMFDKTYQTLLEGLHSNMVLGISQEDPSDHV